ncbi:TrpE Anthranilate/para-aminobenzoate synthases component I [Candidatus Nanopelagicaceae bacterium]
MDLRDDCFWMGGRFARSLIEVTDDLSRLDDGNFWAVSISFEGQVRLARFAENYKSPFPFDSREWSEISTRWSSSLDKDRYCKYVAAIRESIADGWVYQVNACRTLASQFHGDEIASLFAKLLTNNPAPYASYLSIPDLQIASASPELFLRRQGDQVITSPIKGTQKLSEDSFGNKDESENVMIVDLMRNDLGQISRPGSVDVTELLRSEDHPGLRHLVSDVVGKLKENLTWEQILPTLLPAGSISGAPKSSALKVISENEPVPRGPYCGVLGWIEADACELSVAIRTFWNAKDGQLRFGTGAGITWGSDPLAEWEETQLKARKLISIAGGSI